MANLNGRVSNDGTAVVIEVLDKDTIKGVRERLLLATNFIDFVYRESEMDALFSLVDVAITTEPKFALTAIPTLSGQDLLRLRDLIFLAHDQTHESNIEAAAALLVKAEQLLAEVPR
jgi:hypothetical protein